MKHINKLLTTLFITLTFVSCSWNYENEVKENITADEVLFVKDLLLNNNWYNINTINSNNCTNYPEYVKKISDCFSFSEGINNSDISIEFSISGSNWFIESFNYINLYSLVSSQQSFEKFWSPISVDKYFDGNKITIKLLWVEKNEPYFIWIEKED